MSDENKQKIEGMYAASAKGVVPYIIGTLDPQVEGWEAENFIYAERTRMSDQSRCSWVCSVALMKDWDGLQSRPRRF